MAADTKIEWAHDTVNFWWGCVEVSPACDFCYARELDARYKFGGSTHWGTDSERWQRVEKAEQELKRNDRRALKEGTRRRQFINSMSDFFEDKEELDPYRLRALRTFTECPNLDILLLTKRPSRIRSIMRRCLDLAKHLSWRGTADLIGNWMHDRDSILSRNVWLGTTAENHAWAELRVPHLLEVPAAVHFVSCEPLLGWLDLTRLKIPKSSYLLDALRGLHTGTITRDRIPASQSLSWCIAGGESDWRRPSRARPMHPEWPFAINRQCGCAEVPFHFKQWGDWADVTKVKLRLPSHEIRLTVDGCITSLDSPPEDGEAIMRRVGKKNAGRLLDGRTWDELPRTVAHA